MRFERVRIERWRNFEGIELDVPSEAKTLCLVGENGSGKSNILEFLSMAAHVVGISSGIDLARGDPRQEEHEAEVTLRYTGILGESIVTETRRRLEGPAQAWDGSITLRSSRGSQVVVANGVGPEVAAQVGSQAVRVAQERHDDVNHLYLDANRSYPPQPVQLQEWVQAMQQDMLSPQFIYQQAFRSSKTLYGEWIKHMLMLEQQVATEHVQAIRRAREAEEEPPTFEDPFDSYAREVIQVLPHLRFSGVDSRSRTVRFDSAGQELGFDSLSGGEREIAFLIGQIERFGLRRGMLFVDEPELHLNPDLLRLWITYLRDTVDEGQVWLATHAPEAVEVVPPEAVFVLSRKPSSRVVDSAVTLGDRPLLAALSATVGAPAFSLQDLEFVFIEGESGRGERERFAKLTGRPLRVRFVEAGGCEGVLTRLRFAREFAHELPQEVAFKGVLDRDFRTFRDAVDLERQEAVHVLRVDEVENLFLQPELIAHLAERADIEVSTLSLLQETSDRFAGRWVLRRATLRTDLPQPTSDANRVAADLSWDAFTADRARAVAALVDSLPSFQDEDDALRRAFEIAAQAYDDMRTALDRVWRECLGKEVLGVLSQRLGFTGTGFFEEHAVAAWHRGEVPISEPLLALREYLGQS